MKKRFITLTAGITAIMMVASGCSGQTKETPSSTTAVQQETTETKAPETEKETTEKETESPAETSGTESTEPTLNADVPVKIWGTITEVTDRAIYVDNQSENSSTGEIVLTIDPETTRILDGKEGLPVEMDDIELGWFEAYLGPAMTMSLPPQSTPYVVIVNIEEDEKAAQYVSAAGKVEETPEGKVLTGKDKTAYTLADDVQIIPFLTKQMVTLEEIEEGRECLVWLDDDDKVEKIVLFN
ncbi:MAG: hypothetical protein HFG70_02695 [Hungatella sp.]|nr:hypothetical protein [Hungatella sp.]